MSQQLYAEIQESSKYAYQTSWQESPFPIHIEPDKRGYIVVGGMGGRFRLEDVKLYVIEGKQKILIK